MECPSCGTGMELGYILMADMELFNPPRWSPKPRLLRTGGVPLSLENNTPAYRCPSCGTVVLPQE